MRSAGVTHAILRGAIAVVLAVGGVVNLVFGGMFPYNAPVESIIMFFLSIAMFIGAVVLGVFAVLAAIRRSVPLVPERTSPLSVVALVLSAAAFAAAGCCSDSCPRSRCSPAVGARVHRRCRCHPDPRCAVDPRHRLRRDRSAQRRGRRTPLFAGIALGLGLRCSLVVAAIRIEHSLRSRPHQRTLSWPHNFRHTGRNRTAGESSSTGGHRRASLPANLSGPHTTAARPLWKAIRSASPPKSESRQDRRSSQAQ